MKNIRIYIDTNQLYHSLKKEYDSKLDYRLLLEHLSDLGTIQKKVAYIVSKDKRKTFNLSLTDLGYDVIDIDSNVQNEWLIWAPYFVLDILSEPSNIDTRIILVTGCSAMVDVAETLCGKGYDTIVMTPVPTGNNRALVIPPSILIG